MVTPIKSHGNGIFSMDFSMGKRHRFEPPGGLEARRADPTLGEPAQGRKLSEGRVQLNVRKKKMGINWPGKP